MVINRRALIGVLVRFSAAMTRPYELSPLLDRLGSDARDLLQVAGAGVELADQDGNLRFLSVSDAVLGQLETLETALDEGPGLQAVRSGERAVSDDLRHDDGFPTFGPRAVSIGIHAVYSFPMRLDDVTIGALSLYRSQPGRLDDEQMEVAQALADMATSYLLHAHDVERTEPGVSPPPTALRSRILVEQAKGYLAADTGLSVDKALEALRAYARAHGRKLHEVGRDVLDGALETEEIFPRPGAGAR